MIEYNQDGDRGCGQSRIMQETCSMVKVGLQGKREQRRLTTVGEGVILKVEPDKDDG